jgi:hypothetical protein
MRHGVAFEDSSDSGNRSGSRLPRQKKFATPMKWASFSSETASEIKERLS